MLGADSARVPRTVDEIAAVRAVDAQVIGLGFAHGGGARI